MAEAVERITEYLAKWRNGDPGALDRLIPLVHQELLQIARGYLGRERQGHTLQASALVNEAYVRLLRRQEIVWNDRGHFFCVAAQVMRHVLVDYARERRRAKRRGDAVHVDLEEELIVAQDRLEEVLVINEALQSLASIDPRKCRVVELRFFGGMGVEETAEVLGIAPNTVIRDWNFARAWLRSHLTGNAA